MVKQKKGRETNPEVEERKRLKDRALSKNMITDTKSNSTAVVLKPSKSVVKHNGADIVRKSTRKNRFLFSFPGLIGPVSGGQIGELKDLSSKNPILYLHFPQGQMKLFGTIVYPKNRYLTLQFSKGGKNVMCEDYFDTMIVFSDVWWIGRKEENPEEARLELPKELHKEHKEELDFKGGAGGVSEIKQSAKKSEPKVAKQESPITDPEDDCFDGETNLEDLPAMTPTRHSERTAGRKIKFVETSSEDDLVGNHDDTPEDEDKKEGVESPSRDYALENIKNEDVAACSEFPGQVQQSIKSVTKPVEISRSNRSSLVQTTISSMFKKVEDEKAPKKTRKPPLKVSGPNSQHVDSRKGNNKIKDAGPRKRGKAIEESEEQTESENVHDEQPEGSDMVESDKVYKRLRKSTVSSASVIRKASRVTASKLDIAKNPIQADDDETEEFSSTSKGGEDDEGSDEDWSG